MRVVDAFVALQYTWAAACEARAKGRSTYYGSNLLWLYLRGGLRRASRGTRHLLSLLLRAGAILVRVRARAGVRVRVGVEVRVRVRARVRA